MKLTIRTQSKVLTFFIFFNLWRAVLLQFLSLYLLGNIEELIAVLGTKIFFFFLLWWNYFCVVFIFSLSFYCWSLGCRYSLYACCVCVSENSKNVKSQSQEISVGIYSICQLLQLLVLSNSCIKSSYTYNSTILSMHIYKHLHPRMEYLFSNYCYFAICTWYMLRWCKYWNAFSKAM